MAKDRHIATLLFFFAFSVFLLTYSGLLHSDDEMSMVAVTESLVKRGNFAIDQIAWNQDQSGGIGRYGVDGHLYSKYGWAQPVLAAPLYVLAMLVPFFGLLQTTMLFNAIITSLTAAFIFLLARRLGFGKGTGVLLAGLFSFTTLAWVYAKYFFGEPLTTLLFVIAFYVLASEKDQISNRQALIAGSLLGLSVATKSANALFLIFYYLLPVAVWLRQRRTQNISISQLLVKLVVLSIPIALFALSVGAYNYARFGSPLDAGYNADETFNGDIIIGVYGLLFTPGKSLFLYSPILLVFFLGYPAFFRRNRTHALFILAVIVTTILLYGKWHAWHGGWGWGPRFLVPVVPFLLIGALPFLEDLFRRRSAILIIPFSLLTIASFLATLLGVGVDFNLYLLDVMKQHSEFRAGAMFFTIMDGPRSPIPGQISYLTSGNLDFVWAHLAGGVFELNPLLLFLDIAFVVITGGFLIFVLRAGGKLVLENRKVRPHTILGLILLSIATLLMTAFSTIIAYNDNRIAGGDGALLQALSYLSNNGNPHDAIILNVPSQTQYLLNYNKSRFEQYGLLRDGFPLTERSEQRLNSMVSSHQQIWLFQENAQYGNPSLGLEVWLDGNAFKAENRWFGQSRLARYATNTAFVTRTQSDLVFGSELKVDEFAASGAKPGGILAIQILWESLTGNSPRCATSVRLVDGNGTIISQKDREPTDSLLPTSAWKTAQPIQDRLGLVLPANLGPGTYSLTVVVYTVNGTRPLALQNGLQVATLGTIDVK